MGHTACTYAIFSSPLHGRVRLVLTNNNIANVHRRRAANTSLILAVGGNRPKLRTFLHDDVNHPTMRDTLSMKLQSSPPTASLSFH